MASKDLYHLERQFETTNGIMKHLRYIFVKQRACESFSLLKSSLPRSSLLSGNKQKKKKKRKDDLKSKSRSWKWLVVTYSEITREVARDSKIGHFRPR